MATLLCRLAASCFDHRRRVIALWLLLFVAAGVSAVTLSGSTTSDFTIPGQESTKAIAELPDLFPDSGAGLASARVVFEAPAGQKITAARYEAAIGTALRSLVAAPQVATVSNPLDPTSPTVSPDRQAAYSTVNYLVGKQDVTDAACTALHDIADRATASGLRVELGGTATDAPFDLGLTGEAVGLVVALIVLLLTYGAMVRPA